MVTIVTDKSEAQGKIAEQIKIAKDAIAEAERIADEHKIRFNWDGPSYGMGGSYDDEGWSASSQSC